MRLYYKALNAFGKARNSAGRSPKPDKYLKRMSKAVGLARRVYRRAEKATRRRASEADQAMGQKGIAMMKEGESLRRKAEKIHRAGRSMVSKSIKGLSSSGPVEVKSEPSDEELASNVNLSESECRAFERLITRCFFGVSRGFKVIDFTCEDFRM